jgi:hypothetical protein
MEIKIYNSENADYIWCFYSKTDIKIQNKNVFKEEEVFILNTEVITSSELLVN